MGVLDSFYRPNDTSYDPRGKPNLARLDWRRAVDNRIQATPGAVKPYREWGLCLGRDTVCDLPEPETQPTQPSRPAARNPGIGGGGGGGAGLAYVNEISVTPGETLTIVVGAGGSPGAAGGYSVVQSSGISVRANGGGHGEFRVGSSTGGVGGASGSASYNVSRDNSGGRAHSGGIGGDGGTPSGSNVFGAGGAGGDAARFSGPGAGGSDGSAYTSPPSAAATGDNTTVAGSPSGGGGGGQGHGGVSPSSGSNGAVHIRWGSGRTFP